MRKIKLLSAMLCVVMLTTVLGAAVLTNASAQTTCIASPSDLVAWWPGDGNADDIIDENNGTLVNGATFAPGKVAQAFSFNGGDEGVVVPDAPALDFGAGVDFSIDAWIKTSNGAGDKTIVDKRYASGCTSVGYALFLYYGRISLQMSDAPATPGNFLNFISNGPNLADGVFHLVAATVDRDSTTGGKLYVDGVVVRTFNPTNPRVTGDLSNSQPLLIGKHPDPLFATSFDGLIDEVDLFNRALTGGEIQAIFNAGSAGKCKINPIADFSADLTSGYAPLTVQFTDTSISVTTNPITSWSWDFNNDGIVDSTEKDPTHTYAKAGTYTVKLTVSDGTYSDDEIKADYITVEFPIGDVSGDSTVSAYDAALILQFVVGLIDEFPVASMMGSSPEDAIPRHYEVSVPSLGAAQGQHIAVPVQINDATGFIAGGVGLKYDATVLKAVGASLELNGAYWQANTNIDGEVRVAFAKTSKTEFSHSGSWILFVVKFDVLANTEGKKSPLILDYVQLTESLSIKKINGLVTVPPSEFRLHQNYPNPFNPETWIPFQLAEQSEVSISIYDAAGRMIRQILLGELTAGVYLSKDRAAHWDGKDEHGEKVSSGVYFYTLQAGNFSATKKMIILK